MDDDHLENNYQGNIGHINDISNGGPTRDSRYISSGKSKQPKMHTRNEYLRDSGIRPSKFNIRYAPRSPPQFRDEDTSRNPILAGAPLESVFAEFLRAQNSGKTNGFEEPFQSSNPIPQSPHPGSPSPIPTIVERSLPLTLDELFKGSHKKMMIKREAFDEITGRMVS